jgi:DNA-binding response OmpR family regulator
MTRILIVEDDPDIASLLCRGLGAAGYAADRAETVEAAVDRVEEGGIDAAIIDMMLGADSGAALLAELRRRGHRLPAIMLSALSRVEDRAEGLDAGAQDYIVKPFQLSELIARLEVQLRRAGPRLEPIRFGALIYDPAERRVTGPGRAVTLTEREGELLAYLMTHGGRLLTRGEIFDALWAPHGGATENVVDVYLGYLRRKLDNFSRYGLALRTLRGRGFVLEPETAE